LIFALITSPWLGVFGSLFFAAGLGLTMPSLQALTTETVADELRGGALGLYQSVVGLSTIIGTALAGVIFIINPTMPYWVGLVLSMFSLLPALIIWRRAPHHVPHPENAQVV
jgi:MFS family permease